MEPEPVGTRRLQPSRGFALGRRKYDESKATRAVGRSCRSARHAGPGQLRRRAGHGCRCPDPSSHVLAGIAGSLRIRLRRTGNAGSRRGHGRRGQGSGDACHGMRGGRDSNPLPCGRKPITHMGPHAPGLVPDLGARPPSRRRHPGEQLRIWRRDRGAGYAAVAGLSGRPANR